MEEVILKTIRDLNAVGRQYIIKISKGKKVADNWDNIMTTVKTFFDWTWLTNKQLSTIILSSDENTSLSHLGVNINTTITRALGARFSQPNVGHILKVIIPDNLYQDIKSNVNAILN